MALRQFLNGIALVLVFAIALIFFMTQMIEKNNPDGLGSSSPYLNSTLAGLQSSTDSLTTTVSNAKERLDSDATPSIAYPFLIILAGFTIPFAFVGFVVGSIGRITTLMFTLIFGAGSSPFSLVAAVISAILLMAIIFYIIKAIRTGETER